MNSWIFPLIFQGRNVLVYSPSIVTVVGWCLETRNKPWEIAYNLCIIWACSFLKFVQNWIIKIFGADHFDLYIDGFEICVLNIQSLLKSFCLRLMHCILFPTGRHPYHFILQHPFVLNLSMKNSCPWNIPHPSPLGILGRSPLMAWQPLQQPCLQPTPGFPAWFFPRTGFLRRFLELLRVSSLLWYCIFQGWFQQGKLIGKLWLHKTLMWSWPGGGWGHGCFDGSGKTCMKLSEKGR